MTPPVRLGSYPGGGQQAIAKISDPP